jgi:hypothetical protein
MTALVSVYTPEGFIIGADGRRRDQNTRSILSEEVRKIYAATGPNLCLAYGWTGSVVWLSEGKPNFDFAENSQSVQSNLMSCSFSSLADYATVFSGLIYRRLIAYNGGMVVKYQTSHQGSIYARLLLVGYFDDEPMLAEVAFGHRDGLLLAPVLRQLASAPSYFKIVSGSVTVHDALIDAGVMVPPTSIADGEELVRRYIQTCIDNNETCAECTDIGGRLHIAAVTESGFEWRVPPAADAG